MFSALYSLFAYGSGSCPEKLFFGMVPWHHYLPVQYNGTTGSCEVVFNVLAGGRNSDVLLIVLAVVDDLLRLAGMLAVVYIIYAGIKYIMSQGSPDETAKAQSTIVNALGGLALAMTAIAFVWFFGYKIGGNVSAPSLGANIDTSGFPKTPTTSAVLQNILTIVFSIVGALSFLFVTIGGFRYILAQGDPQGTGKAKSTIMYALIGMIVAIIAQAIVIFVLKRL